MTLASSVSSSRATPLSRVQCSDGWESSRLPILLRISYFVQVFVYVFVYVCPCTTRFSCHFLLSYPSHHPLSASPLLLQLLTVFCSLISLHESARSTFFPIDRYGSFVDEILVLKSSCSIRVQRINSCEDKYFNRPVTSHPLRPFVHRRKTISTSDFRSQFSLPFRSFQPCCPFSSLLHIPCAYFVPVHVCTRMFTFSFLLFYLFFRLFPFFLCFFHPLNKESVDTHGRDTWSEVKLQNFTEASIFNEFLSLSLSLSFSLSPSLPLSLPLSLSLSLFLSSLSPVHVRTAWFHAFIFNWSVQIR